MEQPIDTHAVEATGEGPNIGGEGGHASRQLEQEQRDERASLMESPTSKTRKMARPDSEDDEPRDYMRKERKEARQNASGNGYYNNGMNKTKAVKYEGEKWKLDLDNPDWAPHFDKVMDTFGRNPGLTAKQKSQFLRDSIHEQSRGLIPYNMDPSKGPLGELVSIEEVDRTMRGYLARNPDEGAEWDYRFSALSQKPEESIEKYVSRVCDLHCLYMKSNSLSKLGDEAKMVQMGYTNRQVIIRLTDHCHTWYRTQFQAEARRWPTDGYPSQFSSKMEAVKFTLMHLAKLKKGTEDNVERKQTFKKKMSPASSTEKPCKFGVNCNKFPNCGFSHGVGTTPKGNGGGAPKRKEHPTPGRTDNTGKKCSDCGKKGVETSNCWDCHPDKAPQWYSDKKQKKI